MWLPSSEWNGKLLGLGNGGFAGAINYQELALGVSKGYAAAATDMGRKESASFVRLFLGHCAPYGSGVSVGVLGPVPLGDADHDLAAAVERWVEQGIARERIVAGRPKSPANVTEFSRTRPLCAWPKTAHYNGIGSTDDASNFECQ